MHFFIYFSWSHSTNFWIPFRKQHARAYIYIYPVPTNSRRICYHNFRPDVEIQANQQFYFIIFYFQINKDTSLFSKFLYKLLKRNTLNLLELRFSTGKHNTHTHENCQVFCQESRFNVSCQKIFCRQNQSYTFMNLHHSSVHGISVYCSYYIS